MPHYLFGDTSFESIEKRRTLKALQLSPEEISAGITDAWNKLDAFLAQIAPEMPPLDGGGVGSDVNFQVFEVENFNVEDTVSFEEDIEPIPLEIYEEVFAQFFNVDTLNEIAEKESTPQRVTPAVRKVLDYLVDHPEEAELSDYALAKRIGVSHPTVGKARRV
jgi:DNA-binding transcriptional ArsR family regulator